MAVRNREALIQSLADSMGIADTHDTRYSGAHYDESTGTFYCEGMSLPHSSLDRILTWYKSQMNVYRERAQRDRNAMEFYMRYAVAYNAILMLNKGLDAEYDDGK